MTSRARLALVPSRAPSEEMVGMQTNNLTELCDCIQAVTDVGSLLTTKLRVVRRRSKQAELRLAPTAYSVRLPCLVGGPLPGTDSGTMSH